MLDNCAGTFNYLISLQSNYEHDMQTVLSALETLYGGQFTLSTRLINPNYVLFTVTVEICWPLVWQNNRYHSFHDVHFFMTQLRGLTCLRRGSVMGITGTDATSKYCQIILIITCKKVFNSFQWFLSLIIQLWQAHISFNL